MILSVVTHYFIHPFNNPFSNSAGHHIHPWVHRSDKNRGSTALGTFKWWLFPPESKAEGTWRETHSNCGVKCSGWRRARSPVFWRHSLHLSFPHCGNSFLWTEIPKPYCTQTLLSFSRFSLLRLPPKVSPYIFVLHREPTDTLEIDRVGPHGPHPLLRVLALSTGHVLAELPLCKDWDMAFGMVTHGLSYTTQKPGGTGLGEAELLKQETIRSIPCPWTSLPSWFWVGT